MTKKGFGRQSKFYVVFRVDTNEFLVEEKETLFGLATKWGKYPGSAQKWRKFDQVRNSAMMLSSRKGIQIQVCSVTDIGEQYRVEVESTFFPNLP